MNNCSLRVDRTKLFEIEEIHAEDRAEETRQVQLEEEFSMEELESMHREV